MTEKGRYQGQKLSRLWLECNSIEDEIHFMQFCKSIKNKREQFFEKLSLQISLSDLKPSSELLIGFFQCHLILKVALMFP